MPNSGGAACSSACLLRPSTRPHLVCGVHFPSSKRLNGTQAAPVELADFSRRRKGEIAAFRLIQSRGCGCSLANLSHNLSHAVCAVTFRSLNEPVERFPRLNSLFILEECIAFISLCDHVMDGKSDGFLAMKHLPKRRHHALVSGQRSMMNVDCALRSIRQERFLENVRTRN